MLLNIMIILGVILALGNFIKFVEKAAFKEDVTIVVDYCMGLTGFWTLVKILPKTKVAIIAVIAIVVAAINAAFYYWLINLIF